MTLEHRKADICNQMFNQNLTSLIHNLAKTAEELEIAQAKIAEYEAEKKKLVKEETSETPFTELPPA